MTKVHGLGLNTYDMLFHSQIETSMFKPEQRVTDFDPYFVDNFLGPS